ncbi:MAG TPA: hydroxypyruvate isomerase, partial [Flavisolibacter sp.]|nr:hydroxypyruvate isomerase [Flavisolibacter sp.]
MQRRHLIRNLLLTGTAVAASPAISLASCNATKTETKLKGKINHSVCRWTYNFLSLEELCQTVKSLNFSAIDLIGPKEWNVLKKHGIDSSMCNGAEISLTEGWNDKQYHPTLIKNYTE